jgi:protein phosphatase
MIEDEDLMGLMERVREPQQLADELVDEANRRGGLDNVTVIVIRVDGTLGTTHGE